MITSISCLARFSAISLYSLYEFLQSPITPHGMRTRQQRVFINNAIHHVHTLCSLWVPFQPSISLPWAGRRIVGLASGPDLVAQVECRDSQHGRNPNPDTLLSLELPLVSSQRDLWTSGTSSQQ